MMLAVIVSVLTLAIVAFVIGFLCGKDAGRQHQRLIDHDLCLEYARQALHGHPLWRSIAPAAAIRIVAKRLLASAEEAS